MVRGGNTHPVQEAFRSAPPWLVLVAGFVFLRGFHLLVVDSHYLAFRIDGHTALASSVEDPSALVAWIVISHVLGIAGAVGAALLLRHRLAGVSIMIVSMMAVGFMAVVEWGLMMQTFPFAAEDGWSHLAWSDWLQPLFWTALVASLFTPGVRTWWMGHAPEEAAAATTS